MNASVAFIACGAHNNLHVITHPRYDRTPRCTIRSVSHASVYSIVLVFNRRPLLVTTPHPSETDSGANNPCPANSYFSGYHRYDVACNINSNCSTKSRSFLLNSQMIYCAIMHYIITFNGAAFLVLENTLFALIHTSLSNYTRPDKIDAYRTMIKSLSNPFFANIFFRDK